MVTVAKAAELLDITPDAVRRAIQQGRLPATKYGPRAIMLRREDVDRYKATPRGTGRPRKQPTEGQ